jgi:hypothetical protein
MNARHNKRRNPSYSPSYRRFENSRVVRRIRLTVSGRLRVTVRLRIRGGELRLGCGLDRMAVRVG